MALITCNQAKRRDGVQNNKRQITRRIRRWLESEAAILAARSTAATAVRFFVADQGKMPLCATQREYAFINASI